jgi:CubicO group peptidase (beta-lactamase class C family)
MKTKIILFGLVLLALPLSAREIPVVEPAKAGLSATKIAEIDPFMQKQLADQKLAGGVIMIAHNGKIGFARAYGSQNRADKKPMELDTIFRIYSMSKAITTAGALMLCDQGKINLDDPVSKYIPSFANLTVATESGLRPPTRPMLIRDLILHDSGLTYGGSPGWATTFRQPVNEAWARLKPQESTNLAEMVGKVSQAPLPFDPGTDWAYGVGIDVLGRVIEVVSGETLDKYLARTLFKPLDMKDTGFSVPPEKLNRFAAMYSRANGTLDELTTPGDMKFTKPTTYFSGGGGLVGTAHDYMRFLMMIQSGGELDGHRYLKSKTVKMMSTNLLPKEAFPIYFGNEKRFGTGFGLGFAVCTEVTAWDPQAHVGEFGWDGAASTHYWISPADNLIVVTMEQIKPYEWDTERGIKKIIYDSIEK